MLLLVVYSSCIITVSLCCLFLILFIAEVMLSSGRRIVVVFCSLVLESEMLHVGRCLCWMLHLYKQTTHSVSVCLLLFSHISHFIRFCLFPHTRVKKAQRLFGLHLRGFLFRSELSYVKTTAPRRQDSCPPWSFFNLTVDGDSPTGVRQKPSIIQPWFHLFMVITARYHFVWRW